MSACLTLENNNIQAVSEREIASKNPVLVNRQGEGEHRERSEISGGGSGSLEGPIQTLWRDRLTLIQSKSFFASSCTLQGFITDILFHFLRNALLPFPQLEAVLALMRPIPMVSFLDTRVR